MSVVLRVAWSTMLWICAAFTNSAVTLSVYPAITSLIKSVDAGEGNPWNDTYFTPVACILLPNVYYYMGRLTASWFPFPTNETRHGGHIIFLASLARVMFVPFFMLCNASPNNRVVSPVLIHSDAAFYVGMLLCSLSGSHIEAVCMMFGPKTLPDPERQSIAASVMVAWLVTGMAVGAALSSVWVMLL